MSAISCQVNLPLPISAVKADDTMLIWVPLYSCGTEQELQCLRISQPISSIQQPIMFHKYIFNQGVIRFSVRE